MQKLIEFLSMIRSSVETIKVKLWFKIKSHTELKTVRSYEDTT